MNIKWMVHTLKYKLQENNSKISWRSNIVNTSLEGHNTIQKEANLIGCILGYGTYIERGTQLINVKLGRYSSIAPGVKNIGGNHPTKEHVSTYPGFYSASTTDAVSFVKTQKFEEFKYIDEDKKFLNSIGNDVWIGTDAVIMQGVPAKIIRYRFSESDIQFLMELKWWEKDIEWIKKYADYFADIEQMKIAIEREN